MKGVKFTPKEEVTLAGRLKSVTVVRIDASATWEGEYKKERESAETEARSAKEK